MFELGPTRDEEKRKNAHHAACAMAHDGLNTLPPASAVTLINDFIATADLTFDLTERLSRQINEKHWGNVQ